MEKRDYHITIITHATPEQALEKIASVKKWWATNVTGSSIHAGDIFTVRFGNTFSTMEISELVENRRVVWKITDTCLPLFRNPLVWKGTQIEWDIFPEKGSTRIGMTHVGLTPDVECFSDCRKGWDFYVGTSLLKLLNEGQGLPGSGIFSRIIQGDKKYEGLLFYKDDPLPGLPDGYVLVDVKRTDGEWVTDAYSVSIFEKAKFDRQNIRGDHFMLIENKPLPGGTLPFEGISAAFK